MRSAAELAQEFTGLDTAARQHLERLMATWGLLADLSFSDLILYVPLNEFSLAVARADGAEVDVARLGGLHFVVLGQMRPTTNQTLVQADLVAEVVAADEVPLVRSSWQTASIVNGEWWVAAPHGPLRGTCIPVHFRGELIGVLARVWTPTGGRRRGGLERAYLQIFDHLAKMVQAGLFPFMTEDAAVEDPPRVGDGVVVLDAEQRVTFASPNAVNALHRMGVTRPIVSSSFESFGIEPNAVAEAFARRLPVIEEVDRHPDVTVWSHCIPLLEAGRVLGAALLLRDVTDLRRRDRLLLSKDAAIREVHHRVKNNLQTISSLLRLQSRRLSDDSAREALFEAERRIRAIAAVHEILASEPGELVNFDEILPTLLHLAHDSNVAPIEIDIRVKGSIGELSGDVATPLALVLSELLQNAVEHAFAAGDTPAVITVSLASEGGFRSVEVRDNGSGFADGFDIEATRSLGLAIVRDLVRSQLAGSIDVANEEGALVRITVPVEARELSAPGLGGPVRPQEAGLPAGAQ